MIVAETSVAAGNPFIGLRRFEIADSALFFGRNEQSYELLRRLDLLHFVAVIGPSGCGKSSLVRAGVLATLQQGYLAEGGPWKIVMMQPGGDPVGEWTSHLSPHLRPGTDPSELLNRPAEALDTSTGRIAILVDQFEELFQFGDRTGRTGEVDTFLRAMLSTGAPDARIYLILTMRSEYLVRCALYPQLAEAINEGLYLVPHMTREQMRQAIVAPITKAGATITVTLTERLLDDAGGEEDGLPVLQHALMRMWPNRNVFAPLGLDLYPSEGRLDAFLDKHAEQVYGDLDPAERPVAEAVFRCITERTPEGRAVRRAQQLDAIARQTGMSPEQLLPVIRRFESEGFLITTDSDPPLVDISHEAVARQWKRLGTGFWEKRGSTDERVEGWMVAEARERRAVVRLRDATAEWTRNSEHTSYLFRGPQLRQLEHDIARRRNELGERERLFLAASRKTDLLDTLFSRRVLLPVALGLIVLAALSWIVTDLRRRATDAQAVAATAESQATEARAEATVAQNQVLVAETVVAQGGADRTTPAQVTQPRIYTQVWTPTQEAQLQPVLAKLRQKYAIPAVQRVGVGPRTTELRYFRSAELDMAKSISADLAEAGLVAAPRYVGGFEESTRIRANHFELWLAQPAPAAIDVRANVVVLYLDESRREEADAIGKAVSVLSGQYAVTVKSYKAVTWSFINPIELHYFRKEDEAEAGKLTGTLQDNGAFYVKARFMPVAQQIPPRYFEIWLQNR